MTRPENIAEHNSTQLDNLLEAFAETAPAFSWIGTDIAETRDAVIESVVGNLPGYQPVLLDVGGENVTSLKEILDSRFADVLGEESSSREPRIVHILNLHHTLFREILEGEQVLLKGLQQDWEALGSAYPFAMIGWLDDYLWDQLEQTGGEMWGETVQKFQFFAEGEGLEVAAADYESLKSLSQEEEPDRANLLARGELLVKNRVWDLAMDHFEQVLEGEGGEGTQIGSAAAGMGEVYIAEGDHSAALEAFDRAIEATDEADASTLAPLYKRKGEVYERMRYTDESVTAYQKALNQYRSAEENPPTDMMGSLAQAIERQGKLDRSVAIYEAIIAQYQAEAEVPHNRQALAYQQIGAIRQNQQRYSDALAAFQSALESARETEDEFLTHALEDSVEDMQGLAEKSGNKGGKKKKKGFFGRLLG